MFHGLKPMWLSGEVCDLGVQRAHALARAAVERWRGGQGHGVCGAVRMLFASHGVQGCGAGGTGPGGGCGEVKVLRGGREVGGAGEAVEGGCGVLRERGNAGEWDGVVDARAVLAGCGEDGEDGARRRKAIWFEEAMVYRVCGAIRFLSGLCEVGFAGEVGCLLEHVNYSVTDGAMPSGRFSGALRAGGRRGRSGGGLRAAAARVRASHLQDRATDHFRGPRLTIGNECVLWGLE